MYRNYFKVALRKVAKYGAYTLTNIFGLAIGISSSIIIFLYVNRETGYDRFHDKADRIYRVVVKGSIADNEFNHAMTPAPLAQALVHDIDEIGNAVRVAHFGAWLVRYGNVQSNEDNIIFADSSFFDIFSFPLIRGDPHGVLQGDNKIVISQSTAEKYFGEEDPVGKMLQIENDTTYYEVTGVMEDVPPLSHIHFNMVASLSSFPLQPYEDAWIANFLYTYFLAGENVSPDLLSEKVQQLAKKYVIPEYQALLEIDNEVPDAEGLDFEYRIQHLHDIHLKSSLEAEFEPNGNIINIYLFSALAIVVLIISCLNFVNLATARTANLAREVSIRKIVGSERNVLVRQFLTESSVLAMTAMVLALLITDLILPPLNQYMGLDLDLSQLINASGLLLLILLIAGIGILSGLYPAFYLSSFDPLRVMKSSYHQRPNHAFFRKAFVFFQFFVSIGLITMTIIIFRQYSYMARKDLGFDNENLLVIRRPDGLADKLDLFMKKAENHPGVVSMTHSTAVPGSGAFSRIPLYLEDQPASQNVRMDILFVTPSFTETFGIATLDGRFFSPEHPGDTAACVLNQTAARALEVSNPVGHKLITLGGAMVRPAYEIIGVVDDVNFESLENQVHPMVMVLMNSNMEGYLTARLEQGDQQGTVGFLKGEWEKITTAYPFVTFFLDESLKENYQPVRETGRIFLVISMAAILLSCLGLYSLLAYAFCQRRFETGVRKVLGANIVQVIFRQFRVVLALILLSSVLAWTGVYFLARSWLADFYYHIGMHPLYFLLSTIILLVVVTATSGYQTWVAAVTNPGLALKYE